MHAKITIGKFICVQHFGTYITSIDSDKIYKQQNPVYCNKACRVVKSADVPNLSVCMHIVHIKGRKHSRDSFLLCIRLSRLNDLEFVE